MADVGGARAASGPALEDLGLSEDLIIGEAVVLDLRPASFATRALCLALDLSVLFVVMIGVLVVLGGAAGGLDPAAASAVVLVLVVGVLVGIPVAVETATRGRSLGKLAGGLRVVRDDGGPVRFRQSLVRGLLTLLEFYACFFSIALIASLSNARGKRVGDMLAGTYVIRERGRATSIPPVPMPPELAGWAAGADIGRIPDRLAVAARQYLGRLAGLHPSSRQRLGTALAGQLDAFVAPPPPRGTTPEAFLAAVLAERRRRELDRLSAQARARAARERRRRSASPLSATGTALVGEDPNS